MKKLSLIALVAALLSFSITARAQTYGGIWSTSTPPISGSVSFPLILQANNGIYTNGIFAQ